MQCFFKRSIQPLGVDQQYYRSISKCRGVPAVLPSATRMELVKEREGAFMVVMQSLQMLLRDPQVSRFDSTFLGVAVGKKFFISTKGYIGWVLNSAVEGDSMCLFQNCPMPFVIREQEHGYRLIGAAYVHGFMYEHAEDLSEGALDTIRLL
jgi:hypothetical protein